MIEWMLSVAALPPLCPSVFSWHCPHLHPIFLFQAIPLSTALSWPTTPCWGIRAGRQWQRSSTGSCSSRAGSWNPASTSWCRPEPPSTAGWGWASHPWFSLGILLHLVLKTQDWRRNELLAQGPSLFSFQGAAGRVRCCLLDTLRVTGGREVLPTSCRAGLGFLWWVYGISPACSAEYFLFGLGFLYSFLSVFK